MNFTSYKMSLLSIIRNMLPVILMAALIVLGLWVWPEKMLKGFQKFGTGLKILITIFIAIAVFEYQTGIHFPLFRVMVEEDSNGTIPLENSFLICGQREHSTFHLLQPISVKYPQCPVILQQSCNVKIIGTFFRVRYSNNTSTFK